MGDLRTLIPLILLAQSGDRRALEHLFARSQGPLFGYLVGLVGDRHLAEDLLQDVFVLMWRKLPWLREPGLFRSWAYRIASREAFRRLEKERAWSKLLGAELDSVPDQSLPDSVTTEWLEALAACVELVPPASRAVLVLHYQHELTLDEVADVLDLSPGTVKSRLAYGLSVLRQRLKQEEATHDPTTPQSGSVE